MSRHAFGRSAILPREMSDPISPGALRTRRYRERLRSGDEPRAELLISAGLLQEWDRDNRSLVARIWDDFARKSIRELVRTVHAETKGKNDER
jgi:hypothetical protein